MDLALYGRVLLRHPFVIVFGLLLAVVLATYSQNRIGFDGIRPSLEQRKAEVWQSQANVFLAPLVDRRVEGEVVTVLEFENPGRFVGLTGLYSQLATTDEVDRRVRSGGPPFGQFFAAPVVDDAGGLRTPLPIIALFGRSSSPADAQAVLRRGLRAFTAYIAEQQEAAGIPESRRADLRVLTSPRPAVLVDGPKKTLPIVVFLAVLIASIAVAFILENASRRRMEVGRRDLQAAVDPEEEVRSIQRRF
jgi:hypothetical protein